MPSVRVKDANGKFNAGMATARESRTKISKVSGKLFTPKTGTKVKNIRLREGDQGQHRDSVKRMVFGPMKLESGSSVDRIQILFPQQREIYSPAGPAKRPPGRTNGYAFPASAVELFSSAVLQHPDPALLYLPGLERLITFYTPITGSSSPEAMAMPLSPHITFYARHRASGDSVPSTNAGRRTASTTNHPRRNTRAAECPWMPGGCIAVPARHLSAADRIARYASLQVVAAKRESCSATSPGGESYRYAGFIAGTRIRAATWPEAQALVR